MATRSMLKTVDIKTKKLGRNFVAALEKAESREVRDVPYSRNVDYLQKDKIKDFFGEKCIEYTLEQAIADGFLTPYKYYPVVLTLDDDELKKYNYRSLVNEYYKFKRKEFDE